jgi:adenylylsulfate kinase
VYETSSAAVGNANQRRLTALAVLLTGHPSSGKTTLANALSASLGHEGIPNEVLDGDELRERLSPRLGFSRTDRSHQFARAVFVAELLASHGILPIMALVAPFARDRESAARRFAEQDFVEVHLDPPLAVCIDRDTRGVYSRLAARGGHRCIETDVTSIYERPRTPSLRLDTSELDLSATCSAVMEIIRERRHAAACNPKPAIRGRRMPDAG